MNISPEADAAIQTLLSDRTGGLRIYVVVPEDDGSRLEMGLKLAKAPDPADEVLVTDRGSQIFVEGRLSPVLADKTLDLAEIDGEQRIGFRLVS